MTDTHSVVEMTRLLEPLQEGAHLPQRCNLIVASLPSGGPEIMFHFWNVGSIYYL